MAEIVEIILKNIEILIFLVIVVAQVVAAAFAKNKKKPPPSPQPAPAPKQVPSAQYQRQKTERAQPSPQTKHATVKPVAAKAATAKAVTRRADDCEWERFLVESEVKSAQKTADRRAERIEKNARDSKAYDYVITPERERALTTQARSGIVWAEILQPPVSMRG